MNVHNSCIGKIDRILWFNTFFHSLLVSGSDDLNAILWDPLQCQKKCCIKTGHSGNIFSVKVSFYYMTSSMSRQDGPNLALWFATQVGKIELSCLHGIRLCPARKIYHVLVFYPNNKSFIDHGCSVKMAVYRPIFLCVCVYGPRLCLGP